MTERTPSVDAEIPTSRRVVPSEQTQIPDPKVYSELFLLSDDRLEMPHVAIRPETKSLKTQQVNQPFHPYPKTL
jgi:hypothetical protein